MIMYLFLQVNIRTPENNGQRPFYVAAANRRELILTAHPHICSHGLLDGSSPPAAPDLIGRWLLGATAARAGDDIELRNDVFVATGSWSVHGNSGKRRLPPARAGGVLEANAGVPPAPPLKGAQNVWGFSVKVVPRFQSDIGSAHPWLRRRFKDFLSLVWGEQGQAQAVNAQLIRCVGGEFGMVISVWLFSADSIITFNVIFSLLVVLLVLPVFLKKRLLARSSNQSSFQIPY